MLSISVESWQVVPLAQAFSSQPAPARIPQRTTNLNTRSVWTADSAHLVYVETGSDGTRLMRVSTVGSEAPEKILAAGANAIAPAIARQSGRLAYTHFFSNTNLLAYRFQGLPRAAGVRV